MTSSSIIKPTNSTHSISYTIASLLTLGRVSVLQHHPQRAHTKFFKNHTKLYS